MRTKTRKNWKLGLLGATAALALATTACEPSDDDNSGGDPKPSPTASESAEKPSGDGSSGGKQTSSPAPEKTGDDIEGSGGANSGGGTGDSDKGGNWDYADRQKPLSGSVCDNDGQGPYGKVESVNMGGESPDATLGIALGYYECGDMGPDFRTSSATGAAQNVLIDSAHLKVVVGGMIAEELGTKTPSVNAFLDQLVLMQDKGQLKGPKAPEFYFRIDAESDDVNAMPDDESHIIYLYQIIDGD
ncbi:hypothetical protein ACFWY6_43805 [Streptomyces sp. NPDC059037]|uniref:hypothetical protein n=1 Tax=Streptomyces sp. NPDC059037 TaxID=3346710 RepID=UPI0036C8A923